MKTCPKCGKEFTDDNAFCSACGTALVTPGICPNCGAAVAEDAKFCPKCGAKLGFVEEPKNEVAETEEQPKPAATRKSTFNVKSLFIYITLGLVSLAGLFLLIGYFGDIVEGSVMGVKARVTVSYYFGKGMDTIKQYKELNEQYLYNYSLVMYVFDCVLYFAGMIGSFIALGLGIAGVLTNIKKKKEVSFTPFVASVLFAIPHIVFLGMRESMKASTSSASLETGYGWGSQLLIAATFITIIAVLGLKIANAAAEKKNFVPYIISTATTIFLVILCYYGTNLMIGASSGSVKYDYSGFYPLEATLSQLSSMTRTGYNSSSFEDIEKKLPFYIFGALFALTATIFNYIALAIMTTKENSKAGVFASTIIGVTFTIVGTVFLVSNTEESRFGSSTILSIVLLIFILGGLIAGSIVANKAKETAAPATVNE